MTKQDEILTKVSEKKILWIEIDSHEKEYNRLCMQIENIEKEKSSLLVLVRLKLRQIEKIGEFLLDSEYEALNYLDKQNEKE